MTSGRGLLNVSALSSNDIWGASGGPTTMAHFSGGKLTSASLPVAGRQIDILSVASIPGTTEAIAGGFTHNTDFTLITSVVRQYGR